jgi:hypothetical protein
MRRIGLALGLVATLLSACTPAALSANATVPGTYPVDPLFREFYSLLGGEALLGPAISGVVQRGNAQCQYTLAALLCATDQTGSGRYFLAPLGRDLGFHDEPSPFSESGEALIGAYESIPAFVTFYDRHGGKDLIGNALTNVRRNDAAGRLEQYFEGLGFYQKIGEQGDPVHLLAYGLAVCGSGCSYAGQVEGALGMGSAAQGSPFLNRLQAIGGTDVFGKPLGTPYTAADGALEQAFEKVVVFAPGGDPAQMRLRPLPILLKLPQSPPGPKRYGAESNMVFYPVQGEMGFHVPVVFDDFITRHGGWGLAGKPIDEVFGLGGSLYRQCFENYCLDFDASAATGAQVALAALGVLYEQSLSAAQATPEPSPPAAGLQLKVSEAHATIPHTQAQTLSLLAEDKTSGQPVAGVVGQLRLFLPEGQEYTAAFPATASDGTSSLDVPARSLPNGTVVPYRVCATLNGGEQTCVSDAYLIWDVP